MKKTSIIRKELKSLTVDPNLDKYKDNQLFKDKLKKANEFLSANGLPESELLKPKNRK